MNMNTKMKLLVAATLAVTATSSYAQTICVFDPLGSQGDNYSLMKDYAVSATQWGADISLRPYADEKLATNDFKSGKCDGTAITGIRARLINDFVGTISAVQGIMTNEQGKTILALAGNPKLAPDMQSKGAEVVGVTSLGFAYLMVRDRKNNSIADLAKIRTGTLSYDKVQEIVVEKFGGTAVPMELSEVGFKFNSGQVDMVIVPPVAFKPMELYKGMGTQGIIWKFPLALTTLVVLIHPDKFPDGYGQSSRTWFVGQLDRQMGAMNKIEKSIDAKYWGTIPANAAQGNIKVIREARLSLTRDGVYNKKMIGILKKIRCRQDPTNYECSFKDE
ncbi:MAG: putative solute-binding protein [Rickettsiales bacterium]